MTPHGGVWDWRWPDGPGIPGSETAIVEITRRLARRGHGVTVYRDLPPDATDDGPVRWRTLADVPTEEPGEWWLCREPALIDVFQPRDDLRLHLRCDDLHYRDRLTPERAAKLTSVLAMSEWHRRDLLNRYPFLTPEQVKASGCGIATDMLRRWAAQVPNVARDMPQLIWASSYDRGLEWALDVFRTARRHEPSLTFHAHYGWNGFDELAQDCGDQHPLVQMQRRVMASDLTGVTFHPRCGRAQLWGSFLRSSFMVYLTTFCETGAVAVREAQALGVIPIVSPVAALNEACQGGVFVAGDPCLQATREQAVDTLLTLIRQPEMCQELRDAMVPHALAAFDWERAVDLHCPAAPADPPTLVFHRDGKRCEGPLRLRDRGAVA